MIKKKIDKKEEEQLDLLPVPPKTKKKKKKPESRKPIVILFLTTILFSLIFFIFGKTPVILEKINNEEKEEVTDFSTTQGVVSEITKMTQSLQGNYGFHVYSLASDKSYGLNSRRKFESEIFEKIALMIACFQQEESQKFDLKTVYVLADEEKEEDSGVIWAKPAGTHFTYLKLLETIGQYSDSTAINVLKKRVGEKAIREVVEEFDIKETDFDKATTTPRDVSILFEKVYVDNALSERNTKSFSDFLTETAFEKRIPRLLPKDVKVSHLESSEMSSFADAGIVFGEKPFIIVILADGAREDQMADIFPQIAKVIWEFENK